MSAKLWIRLHLLRWLFPDVSKVLRHLESEIYYLEHDCRLLRQIIYNRPEIRKHIRGLFFFYRVRFNTWDAFGRKV